MITAFPKGTTGNTTNLQPRELIHMEFALYYVTSIQGFNYMLTIVCENTIMLRVFTNAHKRTPVKKLTVYRCFEE